MRTVYALTSGEYSDYSVHCVCDTRALAEQVRDRVNLQGKGAALYSAWDVEEMTLVESLDDVWVGTTYRVEVDAEGTEVRRWSYVGHEFGPAVTPDTAYRGGREKGHVTGESRRGYDVALAAARDRLRHSEEV